MRARAAAAVLLAALLLAGCDPAGHPFEADKLAPDATILQVRDSVGVTVAPVANAPGPTADGLAEAVAGALRDLEIPAMAGPGSRHSYQLAGSAAADPAGPGRVRVALRWTLRAADGSVVGTDDQQATLAADRWTAGAPADFADLARDEAKSLAGRLTESAPAEHDPTRLLRIRPVEGAPGDGGRALPSALAYLLKRRGLPVTEDPAASAVTVAGEVSLSALPGGKDHVRITWHVLQPDGTDIGQIAQENDVPHGALDGHWGGTAMAVAMAGLDDIVRVVGAAGAPPG